MGPYVSMTRQEMKMSDTGKRKRLDERRRHSNSKALKTGREFVPHAPPQSWTRSDEVRREKGDKRRRRGGGDKRLNAIRDDDE